MKKTSLHYTLTLLFFVVMAVIVFRCALGADNVFSASDGNIGTLAKQHRFYPESFSGSYSGTPLFGGAVSAPITPIHLGAWLMPPSMFSDSWYSIYLVLSSVFLVAFLRLWNIRWSACVFGALVAFWVGSVTLSAAGHLGKFGVMLYFSVALFVLERGIRSNRAFFRVVWGIGGGVLVGLMLLAQQDVGLLAGLFLGPYFMIRLVQCYPKKPVVWGQLLLPIVLIGLVMVLPVARKAYCANVVDSGLNESPQKKWEFITQWSMVPEDLPDLVAPGYTGWSSGNPEGPYWGRCGQSAEWKTTGKGFRNFRLDNLYIGFVPILFAGLGVVFAVRRLRENREESAVFIFFGIMALAALFLALGKFSVLYKIFYQLPLVGNIRVPVKFMHNFQVMVGILSAFGLNSFMNSCQNDSRMRKRLLYILVFCSGLFCLLAVSRNTEDFLEWREYADIIVRNIRRAWLHAALMAGSLAGIILVAGKKGFSARRFSVYFLILMVAADSIFLTSKYFKSIDVSSYREGNAVLNFLKENQGNERIHFLRSDGPYNAWIGVDGPYHGLNIFNVWQMPRMASDYKEFLGAAGSNLPRLWQLASCKYIAAPANVINAQRKALGLDPKMYFRFAMDKGQLTAHPIMTPDHPNDQVLAVFRKHLPRFALFNNWKAVSREQQCEILFSPSFDPLKTVLLDDAVHIAAPLNGEIFQQVIGELDFKGAVVKTESDQPGILLFTQYWQPGWSVEIDGQPAELLRCNYLCMGTYVPAGRHKVIFHCPQK